MERLLLQSTERERAGKPKILSEFIVLCSIVNSLINFSPVSYHISAESQGEK